MLLLVCSLSLLALALLPTAMFLANLRVFLPATREPRWLDAAAREKVSVLIPARNEATGIQASLDSILSNRGLEFEVIVLDDQSEDATATIVREAMLHHSNLRMIEGIPLPDGWNGKQHACWRLANQASYDRLLFLDADVRLSSDAVLRIVAEAIRTERPLISGFPFQETGTVTEKLLIPMMHFVLLGYLPMARMRQSTQPGLAAGCGQLFLADRAAYFASGGHQAIAASRHDGIKLPRNFRVHGFPTDIFDAGDIARCRMYRHRTEVIRGLLKNADEGIANPRLIGVFSILLLGGSVLPILGLVATGLIGVSAWILAILIAATTLSFAPRALAAFRFRQSLLGVFLHPAAVAWFLLIQYTALINSMLGKRVAWRGRK